MAREKKGKRIRLNERNKLKSLGFAYAFPFLVVIGCLVYFRIIEPKLYDNNNLKEWLPLELVFIGLVIVVAIGLLIMLYRQERFKNWLKHQRNRQNIAKRLYHDNMYIAVKDKNFFTGKEEQRITEYPKVYYRYDGRFVYVRFALDFQKWQHQLIKLGDELGLAMYCDKFQTVQEDGYILNGYIYAPIQSRLDVLEMKPTLKEIQLMQHMTWDYNKVPHALVTGGTGSGKTFMILSLVYSFLKIGATVLIFDPKKTDLSYLETIPKLSHLVKYQTEDMIDGLRLFYESMLERQEEFDRLTKKKAGLIYSDVGLLPVVLVFDEYQAFIGSVDFRQRQDVEKYLTQIILLGRQLGFFIILGMQRPDGSDLDTKIRDQFGLRIAMGGMSSQGYTMMFGDNDKDFMAKLIKGFGYVSIGTFDVQEFYSPFVPKGFDFVEQIGLLLGN